MSNYKGFSSFNAQKALSRRKAESFVEGRHEPLYPMEVFLQNLQIRAGKSHTPTSSNNARRTYLLTGIGKCYECYCADNYHRGVSLRGVTGKKYSYYRCATLQENYCKRQRSINVPGQYSAERDDLDELISRHHLLPVAKVETEVQTLIDKIRLPEAWFEMILAYVITKFGLTDFQRERYNLASTRERLINLYARKKIGYYEFEEMDSRLQAQIDRLSPVYAPEAQKALPLLRDFPALWQQMLPIERRAVLKTMFSALYFDGQGCLRKVVPQPAFEDLIKF